MSLRDQILAATALRTEAVDMSEFPNWPEKVWVREMTGAEAMLFKASLTVRRGNREGIDESNIMAKMLVRQLIDEDGQLIFTAQDAPALGQTSAAALTRLSDVASRLSGMTKESADELEGNSEAPMGPTEDSSSD